MPESTVAQSIVGALGSIAGISGRRAQDGLVGAQAEEVALKNKATKKLIQDDEDASLIGELQHLGYLSIDPATGKAIVDAPRLAKENQDLLARLMGPEANRFFSTRTDSGSAPATIAGIKALDPRVAADPAMGAYPQELGPQTGPSKYVVQLRMGDGSIKPATRNASAAPDDTLITLDDDALNNIVAGRIGRMSARGGLDNNVTMTNLQLDFIEESDRLLQAKLADMGTEGLTDDPAAGRSFYELLNNAHGAELDEIVRERAGLDPEKLREEAQTQWLEKQKNSRTAAVLEARKSANNATAFNQAKGKLELGLKMADQAIVDYDKRMGATSQGDNVAAPKNNAEKMLNNMALGSMTGMSNQVNTPKAEPKEDKNRAKLIAERDAAAKALSGLKPVANSKTEIENPPPFEWNEDKLREMVMSQVPDDMPSPEATAEMAQYARENGVKSVADLAKLPDKNRAMALAGIIAMNARVSPDKKLEMFNSMANHARTGDNTRSPLDAKLDIIKAQNDQGTVINQGRAVDASIANNEADNKVAWAKIGIDSAKFDHDKSKDLWNQAKDIDAAAGKTNETLGAIYKGTMGPDNKIIAPTPEAMIAWKDLRSNQEGLPKGSPLQVTNSSRYLEGMFQMAAAQSVKPGQGAWWDFTKWVANTFMREDGMVNMSPLIETARFEYENGKPTRVSFTDHGATGKETKLVVGAEEFKRYTGSTDFTTFVDAVHSQQAVNLLQAGDIPVTEKNVKDAVAAIRKSAGMK